MPKEAWGSACVSTVSLCRHFFEIFLGFALEITVIFHKYKKMFETHFVKLSLFFLTKASII